MPQEKKQGNQPSRYGQVWFDDRYAEMKDPKFKQAEKIQEIFQELVQRIVKLEEKLDALAVKP